MTPSLIIHCMGSDTPIPYRTWSERTEILWFRIDLNRRWRTSSPKDGFVETMIGRERGRNQTKVKTLYFLFLISWGFWEGRPLYPLRYEDHEGPSTRETRGGSWSLPLTSEVVPLIPEVTIPLRRSGRLVQRWFLPGEESRVKWT